MSSAAQPRLYAVLVGVADYENASLRLKFAADDAELLERVLNDKAAKAFPGGFEVRRYVDRKATKQTFLEGLKWLKEVMKPQDVGIIFFSGHGYRDNDGIFYMLPAEVKPDSIDATALDAPLFKHKLASIKGRLLVWLDACYSAAAEKGAEVERLLPPRVDDFVREMVREDTGVIMMCSSTGDETSSEDRARPRLLLPGAERRACRQGRLQPRRSGLFQRAGHLPVPAGYGTL